MTRGEFLKGAGASALAVAAGRGFAAEDRHAASRLDFALITHNHGDHFSDRFYRTMDGAHEMEIET